MIMFTIGAIVGSLVGFNGIVGCLIIMLIANLLDIVLDKIFEN